MVPSLLLPLADPNRLQLVSQALDEYIHKEWRWNGLGASGGSFVSEDGVFLLTKEVQGIDSVKQTVAGETVDGKHGLASIGKNEELFFEIDCDHPAGMVEERAVDLFSDLDGDEAVLHRVRLEDVGDGPAHHRAKAEADERPGSVLPGGAAAEVLPRDQDLGALRLRAVEDETGSRRQSAKRLSQAFLCGCGEKARGMI
jgi:hypothetical protein